jgi:hypothetical protein
MGIDARLIVRLRRPISDEELVKVAASMCAAFRVESFSLNREGRYGEKPRHALTRIAPSQQDGLPHYEQDGPDIVGDSRETFICAHIWSRFYGEGYERGDWPFLRCLILWLRRNLEGEVWYGGDSSGVCAEAMTDVRLAELDDHFFRVGHDPYLGYELPGFEREKPTCGFCGGRPMRNSGGGQGKEFWTCSGCDANWIKTATDFYRIEGDFLKALTAGDRVQT